MLPIETFPFPIERLPRGNFFILQRQFSQWQRFHSPRNNAPHRNVSIPSEVPWCFDIDNSFPELRVQTCRICTEHS